MFSKPGATCSEQEDPSFLQSSVSCQEERPCFPIAAAKSTLWFCMNALCTMGFPVAQWQRICLQGRSYGRHRFYPWVGKVPWGRAWQPTPVFLPGEYHGQRSLMAYSSYGCRVRQDWSYLACIIYKYWRRKWQPTPVFLLENPRDGGAWWAAVYRVAQSQTRLKRLSSSSSNIHKYTFPFY